MFDGVLNTPRKAITGNQTKKSSRWTKMLDLQKSWERKRKRKEQVWKFIGNCTYYIYCKAKINSIYATGLFLYTLNTKKRFSDVFRRYRKRLMVWNWLLTLKESRTSITRLLFGIWKVHRHLEKNEWQMLNIKKTADLLCF